MHTHFISLEEVKPEGKAKKEFERFLKSERFMTIDDVLCRALVVTVGSWPLEEYEGGPPKLELSSGGWAPCSTGFLE